MSSANETFAHETSLFNSSVNPYAYFLGMGIDLQDYTIRYLRKPRKNGVAITGTFNISGILYTAGAADMSSLLADVLERYHNKVAYQQRSRERKKLRNTMAFIERHPDAMVLPAHLS